MSCRTRGRISVRPFVWENRSLCLGGRGEGAQSPGGEGSRSWEGSGPGRTFVWTDRRTFRRLDVCMFGRMNKEKFSPVFCRTSSPLGPLPKRPELNESDESSGWMVRNQSKHPKTANPIIALRQSGRHALNRAFFSPLSCNSSLFLMSSLVTFLLYFQFPSLILLPLLFLPDEAQWTDRKTTTKFSNVKSQSKVFVWL